MPDEQAPSVVAALERTVHRVLEMLAAELKDLGLTQGEVNALAQLDSRRACTVADLQAATGQRASTITGIVDRLERRGLVKRALNPHDRRSFRLTLTPEGRKARERVRRAFRDLDGRALAAVSDRSAKGFFETLKALDALHDTRSNSTIS
ncbi:MAG TPA: MarR family transcriptional regulator [Thermoleophilaceae bacterium]|jgi:MarR family transcriptional regulator, organic hydroperoxide resistance regulator|nr:MarR family transcriptional regulator [Thermoleophilaceae bacterium]